MTECFDATWIANFDGPLATHGFEAAEVSFGRRQKMIL
jgi:hypothetical protein